MKNKSSFYLYEPLLLYLLLFLPGIHVSQENSLSDFFTRPEKIILYSIAAVTQIVFLLYFFKLKQSGILSMAGKKITTDVLRKALFYFLVTAAVSYAAAGFFSITGLSSAAEPVNISFKYLPAAAFISLLTGYREELFFRTYLVTVLSERSSIISAVLVSSLLFTFSHAYQGYQGMTAAFFNSLVLAWAFYRHKNIHIIALAHALHNFSVLVLLSL